MAELRKCTGSDRFGIEAHEAPVEDFPKQPSQKDGIGRMCKTHWNQYTAGLAREAKACKTADAPTVTTGESETPSAPPKKPKRAPKAPIAQPKTDEAPEPSG